MPNINQAFREIVCKIVYYGPGSGGKTTNLQVVHGHIPSDYRGDLVSLATEQDRTLFFDFLPVDVGEVKGYKTKFQLYTVPGQVYYNATRKLVLRNVDGVVFVADSQETRYQDSIDSFRNLADNLRELGLDMDEVPIVLQYNKRDLPDSVSIEKLEATFNPHGRLKSFEAVAVDGDGVRDTLREMCALVLKRLKEQTHIESDEEMVESRLLGSGDQGQTSEASSETKDESRRPLRVGPPIEMQQTSKVYWRGMGVGTGIITISSMQNERGETEYTLSSNHRILGFNRHFVRTLRFVGEERLKVGVVEVDHYVLQDSGSDDNHIPISAYIEKTPAQRAYLAYAGMLGEIRFAPEGGELVI
ncbi:GTPase [candidate division BRC1 bacterium HGW-BRC1-1]|jgi:hypothetical protein|nr:MAG: GTPase [candidate division BRC1 bacterium HGW-BRC1-1]